MRWSEPVTIYLAVGASFGVSRYLCALSPTAKRRTRATAEGLAATLLWPLLAAAILIKHLRHVRGSDEREEADRRVQARVEEARRTFVIAIDKMLETVRALHMTGNQSEAEQTLYALRESAEQYVGLAEIEARMDEDAAPASSEAELARISGRRGEDLLVAARCAHRRNVSRIKAHYQRGRTRVLRKLSELRAWEDAALSPESVEIDERRKMTMARLEIYLRATDLFSLLEDERAAGSAAKLVNAECSTLRRLNETDGAATERAYGEERCTDRSPQLI